MTLYADDLVRWQAAHPAVTIASLLTIPSSKATMLFSFRLSVALMYLEKFSCVSIICGDLDVEMDQKRKAAAIPDRI